jgi:hypothetical protein
VPWCVVIACEMGGGWGHVLRLKAIAREFRSRGCRVVFLCRDAKKAQRACEDLEIEIEQSPAWDIHKTGFSLNYAHCVWGNGYWDEETFQAHFRWWTERYLALKPDYVLTDYAPTALLAALSLAIPRGALGTGFTLPPEESPMPGLHPWLPLPDKKLAEAEEMLVARMRGAVPSVKAAAHIFHGAHRFLTIFPETDHYEDRGDERYWGPIFENVTDAGCLWPEGSGPRVFFYMSAAGSRLKDLMKHIRRLGHPAVGYIRDMPESDCRMMESPTLRISAEPIDILRAASECDLAVTHGGYSTTARMLLLGARLLICPEQLEQTLLAHRLHEQGLCEFISLFGKSEKIGKKFDIAATSEELRKNAAAFAAKYAGYDSSLTVKEIVHTCLSAEN